MAKGGLAVVASTSEAELTDVLSRSQLLSSILNQRYQRTYAIPAMSYGKAFTAALGRSLEVVRDGAASVMRLEVNPGTATKKPIHLFSIKSQKDLDGFATGSDKDIGGLSDVKLGVDEGHGRFFGTLSNQLPRNAPIQRTGYAGMRTRVSREGLGSCIHAAFSY